MHAFHQFLKIFKTVGYALLELSQRRGVVLLFRLKVYILIADDYEFSHFIKHSSMLLLPTVSKLQYHNNETIKNSLKFSYKGSGDIRSLETFRSRYKCTK